MRRLSTLPIVAALIASASLISSTHAVGLGLVMKNIAPSGCAKYNVPLTSNASYPCAQSFGGNAMTMCYNSASYSCRPPSPAACPQCEPAPIAVCAYSACLGQPPASAQGLTAVSQLSCPAHASTRRCLVTVKHK